MLLKDPELLEPWLRLDQDIVVTRDDVAAARVRLGDSVQLTPIVWIGTDRLGRPHRPFWLKLESLQVTGAFKARGALNSLLAADIPQAGVCTASGGNHGQAVAWAARTKAIKATIFVPTTCPPIKLHRLEEYGAVVQIVGDAYDESLVAAEAFAANTGARLIHPFDQALTVAGAGTSASLSDERRL